jgi:hypothetical protein
MDMRRYLPILLLVFAALFILPQLFKHSSSSALSGKDRGQLTLDAQGRINRAEQKEFSSSGKYTASLADLVARDKVLGAELTVPLDVKIDVSADGKSYVAQTTSDIFSLASTGSGGEVAFTSCREIKSTRGIDCTSGTTRPTTTTRTTTTPTTTSTLTTGTVTTVTTKK